MKHYFALVAVCALLFAGCNNDNESPTTQGTFTYQGVTYKLIGCTFQIEPWLTPPYALAPSNIYSYGFSDANGNHITLCFLTHAEVSSGEYSVNLLIDSSTKKLNTVMLLQKPQEPFAIPSSEDIKIIGMKEPTQSDSTPAILRITQNGKACTIELQSDLFKLVWSGSLQ